MTLLELEKEFKRYLLDSSDYYTDKEPITDRKLLQIWLDCAEPREKKIQELEQENKVLKDREEGFKKQIIGLCQKYHQVYERFPELKDAFLLGDRIMEENEQLQQKWLDSEYEKSKLVSQIEKMKSLLKEIYKEYGFCELVKIRNDLPLEIQEVIKEIKEE